MAKNTTFTTILIAGGALLAGYFLFSKRATAADTGSSAGGGGTSLFETVKEITTTTGETIKEVRDILGQGASGVQYVVETGQQTAAGVSNLLGKTGAYLTTRPAYNYSTGTAGSGMTPLVDIKSYPNLIEYLKASPKSKNTIIRKDKYGADILTYSGGTPALVGADYSRQVSTSTTSTPSGSGISSGGGASQRTSGSGGGSSSTTVFIGGQGYSVAPQNRSTFIRQQLLRQLGFR